MSSSTSDNLTYDVPLLVENETVKKEVKELIHALGKAFGGEAHLLKFLGSQIFYFNKEGLGYSPKNGETAFATHKNSFMTSGQFRSRCKQVGHLEQECKR
jgi:hypothetical protein